VQARGLLLNLMQSRRTAQIAHLQVIDDPLLGAGLALVCAAGGSNAR